MSSKQLAKRIGAFGVLVVVSCVMIWPYVGKADVTGSFGVSISFDPIPCSDIDQTFGSNTLFPDQPCEKTIFNIDFETNLTINVTISGLTIGIHSHGSVTGFEDIILSFATSFGMLNIDDSFVFAQAYGVVPAIDNDGDGVYNEDPPGDANNDGNNDDDFDGLIDEDPVEPDSFPTCYESSSGSGSCLTLFVKKRVNASVNLGGVILSTLAIFEDVNFPRPSDLKPTGATYTPQSQAFGFGDLLTISGQTPSGISVTGQTSICVQGTGNQIKKHSFPYSVNPDCAAGSLPGIQKGPFLFDFEKLAITGVPLAANLTMNAFIECNTIADLLCLFASTWTVTGGPIFDLIRVTTTFEGLPLGPDGTSFSGLTVVSAGGPYLISLVIDPGSFTIANFVFIANYTVNPESNPANLQIIAVGSPGITSLSARLSVQRSGLNFFIFTGFEVNPASHTFNFGNLTLGLNAAAGIVTVAASVTFDDHGTDPEEAFLMSGDLNFTVNF